MKKKKKIIFSLLAFLSVIVIILPFTRYGRRWVQTRFVDAVKAENMVTAKVWLVVGADPNLIPSPFPVAPKIVSLGGKPAAYYEYNYELPDTLYIAVRGDDKEMVSLLISQGADVNLEGREDLLANCNTIEMAELLIGAGIEMKPGIDHLTSKAAEGTPEFLSFCLKAGGDPNGKLMGYAEETPLEAAARSNSVECCKMLLDQGVNINGRTQLVDGNFFGNPNEKQMEKYNSPLQIALTWGSLDTAKYLIDSGAEYDASPESRDYYMANRQGKELLEALYVKKKADNVGDR